MKSLVMTCALSESESILDRGVFDTAHSFSSKNDYFHSDINADDQLAQARTK